MLVQLQVLHDPRQKRARRMRDRGTPEARMDFFRYSHTADNVASFKHDRSEAGLRQVKRSDQTIGAAADDDNPSRFLGHQRFHSLKIFFAALIPDAPMMPPPGWVAEPHI